MPFADKISGTYPTAALQQHYCRRKRNNQRNGFNCFLASRCAARDRPAAISRSSGFFFFISSFFPSDDNGINRYRYNITTSSDDKRKVKKKNATLLQWLILSTHVYNNIQLPSKNLISMTQYSLCSNFESELSTFLYNFDVCLDGNSTCAPSQRADSDGFSFINIDCGSHDILYIKCS